MLFGDGEQLESSLDELLCDSQLNQAALQSQVNGMSTARESVGVQTNGVLDSVGPGSPQGESRANNNIVERPSAGARRGQPYTGMEVGLKE